jgi:hypothetical protein
MGGLMTDGSTSVQAPPAGASFSLGWLMAQLYGPLWQQEQDGGSTDRLPALDDLQSEPRMALAFTQLDELLKPYPALSTQDIKTAWQAPGHDGFTDAVGALHLQVLQALLSDRQQLSAYQLGVALSDTCWLPGKASGGEVFLREFSRDQMAKLQAWLADASGVLPPQSAATVSRSLQNWQNWADTNAGAIKNGWDTAYASVLAALRTQGSAWYSLLSGETDTSGQTSADAWVQAGESMLRTTRLLMLTILRRFWFLVAIIGAATGGLLYLAITYSSGTAKVWTSLATVAAALGVSGAGLRAATLKAAGGIEQDIWHAASLDAHAWAATWLPTLPQSLLKQYRLAKRGVRAPESALMLEKAAPPHLAALERKPAGPPAVRPKPPSI